jgi:hypothetical protein
MLLSINIEISFYKLYRKFNRYTLLDSNGTFMRHGSEECGYMFRLDAISIVEPIPDILHHSDLRLAIKEVTNRSVHLKFNHISL